METEAQGHQKWWCSVCDCKQVDSADPASGKFYHVHGHLHHDYTSLSFAVCSSCNPLDALKQVQIEHFKKPIKKV